MNIPPFGEINRTELEEYYEGHITIDGKQIEIDINFESESIEETPLRELKGFIDNIDNTVTCAFNEIAKDWDKPEESETTRFYLQHHLNEFSTEETLTVFGTTDVNKSTYLNALQLVRIGLYPEDEESYAVFDIQLPKEYTNYILAVTFNEEGELSLISMDS